MISSDELQRALRADISKNPTVTTEFDAVVDDVMDTLVSLSPTETGEYRRSHRRRDLPTVGGLPRAEVYSDDDKARFIEYGTEDTEQFAPYRRTAAIFT